MSDGLTVTLALLAKTENEAAVNALIPALDHPVTAISEGALSALLERRSRLGQQEILRRLHVSGERWRPIIDEKRGRLSYGIRDGVLSKDPQMCANACQAIVWFREYELLPVLITALEDKNNPHADLAAAAVADMAAVLYEDISGPRDYRDRRDPQLMRRNAVAALEVSVQRINHHKRPEVAEAFLSLTSRDNVILKQILLDSKHASYAEMLRVMSESERPGVIRLLLSFLDDPHPPTIGIATVFRRADDTFLQQLLKKIGDGPSSLAAQHLKRISDVPWTELESGQLDQMDDAQQSSAVKLLSASGIDRDKLFAILEHLIRQGKAGGRKAALDALGEFQRSEVNQLILGALNDEDPHVQAAAIRQLHDRRIPGTLPRLIELSDSPSAVVREAVRDTLTEFRFGRYLAAFDMLDDDVRRSTGQLVRKIDHQTVPRLLEELKIPSRTRRLRAVQVAIATGSISDVEEALINLLDDDDHVLRLELVRALADSDSYDVQAALTEAQGDRSELVREAATQSLLTIQQRAAQRGRRAPIVPDYPRDLQNGQYSSS